VLAFDRPDHEDASVVGQVHALEATLPASSVDAPLVPSQRFAPGQRLAGRYEVVRFIANGGMGEVYEARDVELDVHIALKTIRRERGADPMIQDYFRREIQAARKITHRNACRLFDVGFHTADDGEAVAFLTMELLDGETLADRIRRTGPLPIATALPIVTQITAALDAAHAAGIVHRDLKSQNVMLVGDRTVVMDFGLARAAAGADVGLRELSETGQLVGTPHYVAPEQISGDAVTPAADVYALGVVMFEMVTGTLPFDGTTPMAVIAKRLAEPAPSPRDRVPSLDPRWERVIARCLEREPAARYQHAAEVTHALEVRRPTTRRGLALVVAAVVGIAIGIAVPARSSEPSAGPHARRTIAVLGFHDLQTRADSAWLATGLAEMFVTELAAGDQLRVIPADSVARARLELAIADTETPTADDLRKLQTNLGVDLIVSGAYLALDDGRLRLDLRLQDAVHGTTSVLAETGTSRELFDLVSRAGATLRGKLGIADASKPTPATLHAALPSDPIAARSYAEGLAKLQAFDALAARDKLAAAVAAEPSFALAHSALSEALASLGYEHDASVEAQRAFDAAGSLPKRDHLLVEARLRETTKEWPKAADAYRALFEYFPDEVDYGLGLARALTEAGRATDAFATLDSLHRLPEPARSDPRIDLAEARACDVISDFHRKQAAAARAAAGANARGAMMLLAQARVFEANASRKLGDAQRTVAALGEARAIYESLGYRHGVAETRHGLAINQIDQGDLAGARLEEEAALALFEAIGDRRGAQGSLSIMAEALQDLGDLAHARERYEQALAIAGELAQPMEQAGSLMNIGAVALLQGDGAAATTSATQALAKFREVGHRYGEGMALGLLGMSSRAEGDPAAGRTHLEAALATFLGTGDRLDAAEASIALGGVLRVTGDLAGARKTLEAARATCTDLRSDRLAAHAGLELARLAFDEGHAADAERGARDAATQFASQHAADDEASARAFLAVVLASLERATDAATELARARERADHSQSSPLRAEVAIAAARVTENPTKALAAMPSSHVPYELQLEARLLARRDLAAVARDARAHGFSPLATAAER
jgi:TolB-like protein/Tfp pilus assembly protein PilF